MSSATAEERARRKAERKLEKQRAMAEHDLPRSMRPSTFTKTITVIVLVLVLIYFLFPIYWAIIASTKTPAQMTGSNGMWFAVPLDQLPDAIATNYSKLLGWTRGNFWRWVLNSLIYSGVSALVGTIVSVMAGYATAKFNFRGKNAAIGIIMACMLMPAALLTIPLRPLLSRIPPRPGLALSFALFLVLRDVNKGFLGLADVPLLYLPRNWYANTLSAGLGFPAPSFVSSDYFPLLLWLFLFWAGFYLYRLRPETPAVPDIRLPGIGAIGRRSLMVYLLHQPVIYGLLALIFS